MEHTQNYQLSQWSRTDQVKMDDFNADNAKLDAALKAEADARAAETSALAAQVAKLGNCRVETWSYIGNGKYGSANPNRLTFSASPKLVVILGQGCFGLFTYGAPYGTSVSGGSIGSGTERATLSCTWKGNVLEFYSSHFSTQLNDLYHTYYVIAFYAKDEV